jgi:hypothetical protein
LRNCFTPLWFENRVSVHPKQAVSSIMVLVLWAPIPSYLGKRMSSRI